MLLYICLGILVMGIIIYIIYDDYAPILAIGSVVTVISIFILFCTYLGIDGQIESMKQEYQAIMYKMKSEDARDKFGFLNKQIIDEVQEWNCDLAFNKENQKDFWIGIYIPNIYDEFEYIEYE